jgi:succinoglycan biosynthesis transport protein ExoP
VTEENSSSGLPANVPPSAAGGAPSSLPTNYESAAYDISPHDYYPMSPAPESDGTDWRRLAGLIWRKKWWILAAGLLGATGGVIGSNFIEPVYVTRATIWLDQPDPRRGAGGPIRPEQVFGGQGWASVLRSRAVLRPVAERLQLFIEPVEPDSLDSRVFADFALAEGALPGRYRLETDDDGRFTLSRQGAGQVQRGRVGEPIGQMVGFVWQPERLTAGELEFEIVPIPTAIGKLSQALSTGFNETASIINASLTWDERRTAPLVLNSILEQFIRTATDLKNEKLRLQIEILKEQTNYAADRLTSAELALQNFQVATITEPTDPEGGDAITPIDPSLGAVAGQPATIFGAFFAKRVQQDALRADLQQLQQILSRWRAGDTIDILALRMIPSAATAPDMTTLVNEYTTKQVELRTLLYTYTEQHQLVKQKRAEIDLLKSEALPVAVGHLINQLKSQLEIVNDQLEGQEEELRKIPYRSIEQTRLQRELAAASGLHSNLQGNLKQVELAEATSFPDIQILDSAIPAQESVSTEASRIIMLATATGLGLGLALVLLLNLLDRRIHYPEQITRRLGLPVLGIVPRLDAGRKHDTAEAQVAIESFRGIRTQLSHVGTGNGRGITLITSPAPQDGKSMVAANLAISNATAGHRTVLVDVDTRRGRAQTMFQLHKSPGLTDYLLDRATLEEVQQATSVDGLTLIARGDARGFSPDLLEGSRMHGLLDALSDGFDVVVLDAPPLVAGADALVVGQRSDKVVLVVRAGATDQELARTKLEMLGSVPIPLVGAVLNAVPNTADYYRYYASYYYADAEAS